MSSLPATPSPGELMTTPVLQAHETLSPQAEEASTALIAGKVTSGTNSSTGFLLACRSHTCRAVKDGETRQQGWEWPRTDCGACGCSAGVRGLEGGDVWFC
ncbi:small cell adhesion glycoprotein isoform X1 [Arvicola amphibius]|uniref:small cell adhesion glycoprotein isoform X1 n=1 Tax=Arvicola amphibius TaxID=1047088 RepID=UPI0018E36AEB|nr:small cell adhesion glycoprotein isoform X1 [Arvicola amphibius]